MNSALSDAATPSAEADAGMDRQAVLILADARARCIALGLDPVRLGELLVDEASLAWLVGGLDDAEIRRRLDGLVDGSVRPWIGRLRHRSGFCDCVAEVHFESLCEAARGSMSQSTEGTAP